MRLAATQTRSRCSTTRAHISCQRWTSSRWRGGWWRRSPNDCRDEIPLRHRLMTTVLLTGGTGYIGSHTCVELINAGFETILFDNLCNSSPVVVDRIERITGTRPLF